MEGNTGQDFAEKEMSAALEQAKTYLKSSGKFTLYFTAGSTITETDALPEEFLKNLKLFLDNQPGSTVMVTGHADTSGPKAKNTELSRLRAEFVKDFLVSYGINGSQVRTSYKSDNEPEAPNSTPEGRSRNRRVEINVLI
jgi:outer membrane protein OmpA-like peptidoglycan-associated protein